MLIEGDASALEIVGAAYLSQDEVLCQEIRDGVDIHSGNQERLKLPTRLVAKTFVFRLIYGGTEFAYAQDPAFNWINNEPKFWKGIIDEFYGKYTGLLRWHEELVRNAQDTSIWTSPTGRQYRFEPYRDNWGRWKWPRTKILNYPVQGLGADLMSIARVSASRRINSPGVLFVNTVHDSILLDSPNNIWYDVGKTLENVFVDIPRNFERLFNREFNLPMKGEVKFGMDWRHMEKLENYANRNHSN